MDKPKELQLNFRYSEKIRKVAHAVFERLIRAFPDSADAIADASFDYGRVDPSFCVGSVQVARMLERNPGVVVLTRHSPDPELCKKHPCVAITESKGLEFASVVILDFFTDSSRQKAWKEYLLEDAVLPPDAERDYEMEVPLFNPSEMLLQDL
jgi:hypothetical protein